MYLDNQLDGGVSGVKFEANGPDAMGDCVLTLFVIVPSLTDYIIALTFAFWLK